MKIKQRLIAYFIFFVTTTCVIFKANANITTEDLSHKAPSFTTVKVKVINETGQNLSVINKNVDWGSWIKQPLSNIPPYSNDNFSSKGSTFSGTDGNVEYSIYDGSFNIYFSESYWGVKNHRLTVNDPKSNYNIYCEGCGSSNLTIYVKEKVSQKKYNAIFMSDPQAWRLDSQENDPNKDQKQWEDVNLKVSTSIKSLERTKNFAFGVVNGDITEFGRQKTRVSFDEIYTSTLKTKLLLGLGNHDYANNVNDCIEPEMFDFSLNACARGAFFDIIKRMDGYAKILNNYSYDYDKSSQSGSGAYSWDLGDMHYVQLHNYPTYKVLLDHYATKDLHVNKSISWLENDLKNAHKRGKATILNFHDTYDHFTDDTSVEEKEKLEKMISDYNVIAIFSGHSHTVDSSDYGFLDGVKYYNSGALFKGDYLAAEINGKCIKIDVYNGISGEAKFVRSYPQICGK
ncbi:metallophosphoesterase [Aeromonas salmonicida]|uniref:metallophosphoesterase n=1 Tax=Aeromonas salmonicida TaxID=645 RepID=UPI003D1D6FFA